MVAVRYPSVVLRLRCAPFPRVLGPTRGPRSRTRGWPQPGHGIVGTVRGLGRNRARRYRRINNTGSRSYVKRPPCYARRYCTPSVGQIHGRGRKKEEGGGGTGCRRYVLPTATCFFVQRGCGADHLLPIYLDLPPFLPLLPIRNRILFSAFSSTR